MSGFPHEPTYSETQAKARSLARSSAAWRDSTEGQRHIRGSSYEVAPSARTPDADDICDAAYLRAWMMDRSDRNQRRAADLLEIGRAHV